VGRNEHGVLVVVGEAGEQPAERDRVCLFEQVRRLANKSLG
jgi:hypothetical protein